MGREEILLKEYEVCEQDINLNRSRYWIAAGIFIGINTALWGVAAYNIIPLNTHITGITWLAWPLLVSFFGLGMIIAILFLIGWGNRIDWEISVRYGRMREIETELGMKASLIINLLDKGNTLTEEKKQEINNLRKAYPSPPRKFPDINAIYGVLIALWAILIIVAWLFPILSQN